MLGLVNIKNSAQIKLIIKLLKYILLKIFIIIKCLFH